MRSPPTLPPPKNLERAPSLRAYECNGSTKSTSAWNTYFFTQIYTYAKTCTYSTIKSDLQTNPYIQIHEILSIAPSLTCT